MYSDDFKNQVLSDYESGLSKRKIATKYNINRKTVDRWVEARKRREDTESYIAEGQELTGTSALIDPKTGEAKLVWVKSKTDQDKIRSFREGIVNAATKAAKPLPCIERKTLAVNEDQMSCYVLSDFHLGMYATQLESGEDWSTEKAGQLMNEWIDKAVSLTPQTHTGLLLQLGDFLHFDSITPVTPANKHVLDADVRFSTLTELAATSIMRAITRMLERHEEVHVILASGNHDESSSIWLRTMFSILYKDNPRVTINRSETDYYCFEWGDTSIFAHHGHKRRLTDVSKTFVSQYRDVFGRTKYSYGHIGHFHHTAASEDNLMQVEIHPTLAPKDAYASKGGWHSQRQSRTIIYDKKYGEVGRITLTPDMLLQQ